MGRIDFCQYLRGEMTPRYVGEYPKGWVIFTIVFALTITLAFYGLRSIGVYKLAKKQGLNYCFLAWIPFAWVFTVCKLIGKTRLFSSPFEKIALTVCILYSAVQLVGIIYNFMVYFPYAMYYFNGGQITFNMGYLPNGVRPISVGNDFVYIFPDPYSRGMNAFAYASSFVGLLSVFIVIPMYISLFRKFYPEHFILASVLSFLGFFAPFVFAIRNRKAVDYAEYLRSRYGGRYANPYYHYGQNGGQGGQSGQDGQQQQGGYQTPPDTPFEDFAERGEVDPGNPFPDFDNKDGKK